MKINFSHANLCLHKVPRHLKVCRLLKGIGIIMIRFIFVVLFVVLFLILSTPLMLVGMDHRQI